MTVPAFVRHELEAARAAGVPFDVAWPAALDAIPGAAPGRRAWIVALASTRGEWAGAFTGRPSTARWAVALKDAADELTAVSRAETV